MEENEPTQAPGFAPPAKPDKPPHKIKLAWVLAIIMALAAGAFAWLYFTKDTEAPAPSSQNATDDSEAETEEELQPQASQTVYQAGVGKFRLTLDDGFGIVENLDGNFEGGPATSIEVGEVSDDSPGVVVGNPAQAFSIFARPEAGATLANNSRTQALEANELAERQADTTFAEQAARVYLSEGLFVVKHIVFVRGGLAYEIELINEDQTQADTLEAVEAGWTFVE